MYRVRLSNEYGVEDVFGGRAIKYTNIFDLKIRRPYAVYNEKNREKKQKSFFLQTRMSRTPYNNNLFSIIVPYTTSGLYHYCLVRSVGYSRAIYPAVANARHRRPTVIQDRTWRIYRSCQRVPVVRRGFREGKGGIPPP